MLLGALRPCFTRTQTWVQAGKYLSALASELPSRSGWTIAEYCGDRSPDCTQRLLNRVSWDEAAAMSQVRRHAVAGLDQAAARCRRARMTVGALDETMVAGLSSKLPSAMFSGLTAQGVPAATAASISHLPPIGVLFASFLGYNPMQQLLGPLLHHLTPAHAAYLAGREFFPHLITAPFHSGLGVAFGFAIAANVIAATASALTGKRTPEPAVSESLGDELAAAAAEAGFAPAELVAQDDTTTEPAPETPSSPSAG